MNVLLSHRSKYELYKHRKQNRVRPQRRYNETDEKNDLGNLSDVTKTFRNHGGHINAVEVTV